MLVRRRLGIHANDKTSEHAIAVTAQACSKRHAELQEERNALLDQFDDDDLEDE